MFALGLMTERERCKSFRLRSEMHDFKLYQVLPIDGPRLQQLIVLGFR